MECIQLLPLFNYKQQVIVHILLVDKSPSQKQYVKSVIDSIKGVKDSFFTPNSNISDIVIFAAWNEQDIQKKLNELKQIPSIKSVTPFLITNNQLSVF